MSDFFDDHDDFHEPIEGYCMSCRSSVEIENPQPVWTRKGQAATRGECAMCGGTVFRMGKTHLHDEKNRPQAVVIDEESEKRKRAKLPRNSVYVNFSAADAGIAHQIADDLEKSGMAVWLHEVDNTDTHWASGVHPALKECSRMVYVLSGHAISDEQVVAAWQFFREQRKPIVIAQIAPVDPPDAIRRSPRFDFAAEYKQSLRQMVGALSQ